MRKVAIALLMTPLMQTTVPPCPACNGAVQITYTGTESITTLPPNTISIEASDPIQSFTEIPPAGPPGVVGTGGWKACNMRDATHCKDVWVPFPKQNCILIWTGTAWRCALKSDLTAITQ